MWIVTVEPNEVFLIIKIISPRCIYERLSYSANKYKVYGQVTVHRVCVRRMFPLLGLRLGGLEPDRAYHVAVDFAPVDRFRYRYIYHRSQWAITGQHDDVPPAQTSCCRHATSLTRLRETSVMLTTWDDSHVDTTTWDEYHVRQTQTHQQRHQLQRTRKSAHRRPVCCPFSLKFETSRI